jgi:flap endonuclease-1
MGIKGLKALIRKYAPESIQPFNINTLNGKTVAVDSSILLYKYRYLYKNDDFHIIGFKSKVLEFERLGIKPIFVFDGPAPEAKKNVLKKRSEARNKMKDRLSVLEKDILNYPDAEFVDELIDSDDETDLTELKKITKEIQKIKKNLLYVNKIHSTEVIELLKSLGIPFFESFGEAEESCVFLQKKGDVDYILTEDTDSLTFGGTNIITTKQSVGYEIINLQNVLIGLKLNMDSFIDLCILCGCDYTSTIPKVGPVTAYKCILKWTLEEIVINYKATDTFNYQIARNLFKQNNDFLINF